MENVPDPGQRHGAGPEDPLGAGGGPCSADPGHGHAGHDHRDCDEALAELYTFLDGELTEQRRIQIAHHLDDCSPCLEVYDFEAELRLVIRQRCQEQVPETLRRQVADRLTAALAADGCDTLDLAQSPPPPPPRADADPGITA